MFCLGVFLREEMPFFLLRKVDEEAVITSLLESFLLLVVRDQELKSHSDPRSLLPDTGSFFHLGLSSGTSKPLPGLRSHLSPSLHFHSRSWSVSAASDRKSTRLNSSHT